MRSAASLGNPIFICLLVIATVTFQQCVGQNETIEWRRFTRATSDSDKAPENETKMREFVIGKDAPVWLAFNRDNRINFRRYDIPGYSQQSVVGEAVQHYFNNKNDISFEYSETHRRQWRVYGYIRQALIDPPSESDANEGCTENNGCKSDIPSWKEGNMRNVYPTVLVIFDMQHLEKIEPRNAQREVAKRITYISAFWNMVNMKLNKFIKSTKITIRIAGIILAETPNSFATWTGMWKSTLQDTLNGMKDSFDKPTWTDQFPRHSYDFVAVMTSASVGGDSAYFPKGASTWRVPCVDDDHPIGDIMFWDNFSFAGLESAVQEMINVLGTMELEHRMNLIPRAVWAESTKWKPNKCALHRVAAFLPLAWCLSIPKEHFPPGKPVRSILPGEMMTVSQYCATLGHKQHLNTSKTYFSCSYIHCQPYGPVPSGQALDGTPCQSPKSMMCMDGECVRNTRKEESN